MKSSVEKWIKAMNPGWRESQETKQEKPEMMSSQRKRRLEDFERRRLRKRTKIHADSRSSLEIFFLENSRPSSLDILELARDTNLDR